VAVEVYPAASLKQWKLPYCGYKQPRNAQARAALMDDLLAMARLSRVNGAFEAVIAALTTRAATRGMTIHPDDEQETTARTEGWVALSETSLSLLAQTKPRPAA
jgi:hypothetical protein